MNRPATLADWLAYLETLHPKTIALGLERVAQVHARMDATLALPGHHRDGHERQGARRARCWNPMLRSAGLSDGTLFLAAPLALQRARADRRRSRRTTRRSVEAFNAVEDARGDVALTYFEYGTLAALRAFVARGTRRRDPRSGARRAPRCGQHRRRRRRRGDDDRSRSHGLPRPDARGTSPSRKPESFAPGGPWSARSPIRRRR